MPIFKGIALERLTALELRGTVEGTVARAERGPGKGWRRNRSDSARTPSNSGSKPRRVRRASGPKGPRGRRWGRSQYSTQYRVAGGGGGEGASTRRTNPTTESTWPPSPRAKEEKSQERTALASGMAAVRKGVETPDGKGFEGLRAAPVRDSVPGRARGGVRGRVLVGERRGGVRPLAQQNFSGRTSVRAERVSGSP